MSVWGWRIDSNTFAGGGACYTLVICSSECFIWLEAKCPSIFTHGKLRELSLFFKSFFRTNLLNENIPVLIQTFFVCTGEQFAHAFFLLVLCLSQLSLSSSLSSLSLSPSPLKNWETVVTRQLWTKCEKQRTTRLRFLGTRGYVTSSQPTPVDTIKKWNFIFVPFFPFSYVYTLYLSKSNLVFILVFIS